MINSQQLLLSPPLRPKRPWPPHPQPKPLSFPSRESRMMIQRISHPQLLFLDVELLHPQEEAVKSLIRVPPILFYGLSYDGFGDVCRIDVKKFVFGISCKNA